MKIISCLSVLFFSFCSVSAQETVRFLAVDDAALDYLRTVGSHSTIYQGAEQQWHPRTTNHPYYRDERPVSARLSYNNIVYPDVLIRLDWSRNELIIFSPDNRNLVLFEENVDFAHLHGKHVIYFQRDSLPGSPPTGYYVLLHSQKYKVLKRQTATLTHSNTAQQTKNQHFVINTNYFLLHDGIYHNIRSKRALLRIFQPQRKELEKYISSNRLRFRADRETFITQTVREYERLTCNLNP